MEIITDDPASRQSEPGAVEEEARELAEEIGQAYVADCSYPACFEATKSIIAAAMRKREEAILANVKMLDGSIDYRKWIASLQAEIAMLRAAQPHAESKPTRAVNKQYHEQVVERLQAKLNAAEAERDRLREALRSIKDRARLIGEYTWRDYVDAILEMAGATLLRAETPERNETIDPRDGTVTPHPASKPVEQTNIGIPICPNCGTHQGEFHFPHCNTIGVFVPPAPKPEGKTCETDIREEVHKIAEKIISWTNGNILQTSEIADLLEDFYNWKPAASDGKGKM